MADMDEKSEAQDTKNGAATATKPRARRAATKSADTAKTSEAATTRAAPLAKAKRPRAKPAAAGGATRKAAPKPSARSSRSSKASKPKAKAPGGTGKVSSATWIGLGSAAAIGSAAVAAAVLYTKRSKPEPKVPAIAKDEEAGGD